METPNLTPVVFKPIARGAVTTSQDALNLAHCNVEYHKTPSVSYGHYLLISHKNPFNPIKLYQSGLTRLLRNLKIAFEEVAKMELNPEGCGSDELYDCGVINSYDKMEVRLVISTFKDQAHVWLRLYTKNEANETIPTKFAVRFSPQDNLDQLEEFITKVK